MANAPAVVSNDGDDDEITKRTKKINWDKLDPKIEYAGRVLTLPGEPSKMPLSEARKLLERMEADEQQPYRVFEIIDAFPHDGAVAFAKAMRQLYGWSSPQTVMTFFGPKPPTMLSIRTGPGVEDVVQCPLGSFKLPNVENLINTMFHTNGKGEPVFLIHGELKKKDRHIVLELATLTRQIVARESIYRGRPIRLGVEHDGSLNLNQPPEFMDVSEISEEQLMFDADIQSQIDTNILVPIRATALCREHQIPLKRGILLEGPYGTGKSLTARLTARVAERNGWTFILIDRVQGLKVALEFANRYAPAVVFAEDIDRMAEERDENTNDLVNIIDGVVSKRSEIMTILTTNFVEKLDPVILRPGRLDAVISVRPPGPETVQRLIRLYARGLLADDEPLDNAGEELKGQIPASIRECTERAKLAMIGRNGKSLTDADLVVTAKSMKNHLALLNRQKNEPSHADNLANSLKAVLGPVSGNGHDTSELLSELHDNMGTLHNRVRGVDKKVDELRMAATKR